jgi:3-hydroxyisobutyrate dehydrogenase
MKVGLIGLGAMGAGMAKNLADAGLLTAVYNRTKSKSTDLSAELNVISCTSPQQLAALANIILICVSADEDVLEMVKAITETTRPNSIVIDTSTVSNETAKKASALLSKKQVAFLDAPVSGGVEGAKNGTLAMMIGGNEDALEKAQPVLEAISSRIVYMGETGTGQSTKAVNQIMAAGINQAVTEALAFGQTQGLAMDKVIDVVSGGAAGNWFLQHRGSNMTNGTFEPGFKLSLHHKDLKICQKMAQQTGASLSIADKTVSDYERLMAQGLGDEDISALYRLKRPTLKKK